MSSRAASMLRCAACVVATLVASHAPAAAAPVTVTSLLTSDPVVTEGAGVAVWVHPSQPGKSLIIGADKGNTTVSGGIHLYDLAGKQLARTPAGQIMRVHVLYGVTLGGKSVDLVVASERRRDELLVYRLDGNAPALVSVGSPIVTGVSIRGGCAYRSTSGKYYVFVTDGGNGKVEQWELVAAGSAVTAIKARTLTLPAMAQGCAVDAAAKALYIAEKNPGVIWRYGSEPASTAAPVKVDDASSKHFSGDVEEITIYRGAGSAGYLLVANRGDNAYAIYERAAPNRFVGSLRVTGATRGEGAAVQSASLGATLPQGALVVHDGDLRYVVARWDAIAALFTPRLVIDTSVDPRAPTGGADGGVGPADAAPPADGGADTIAPDAGSVDAASDARPIRDAAGNDGAGGDAASSAVSCRENADCAAGQTCRPLELSCNGDRCTVVSGRCEPRRTTRLGCALGQRHSDEGSSRLLASLALLALLLTAAGLRRRRRR